MKSIIEITFSAVYLIIVIILGYLMIRKSGGIKLFRLFGIMAVILGIGDAFHLLPRAYAIITNSLETSYAVLGFGKLITSITMTIFYLLLYHVWRERYGVTGNKALTITLYFLAAVRIALCMFSQNEWFSMEPPLSWGIYRNIPFVIMGIIIVVLFAMKNIKQCDRQMGPIGPAVLLSFAFYIPVVLWAGTHSWVGVLMMPKTLMYVWIVVMGYRALKRQTAELG